MPCESQEIWWCVYKSMDAKKFWQVAKRRKPFTQPIWGTNPADTFILDFQLPNLWDTTFLLFWLCIMQYFAKAALDNIHRKQFALYTQCDTHWETCIKHNTDSYNVTYSTVVSSNIFLFLCWNLACQILSWVSNLSVALGILLAAIALLA